MGESPSSTKSHNGRTPAINWSAARAYWLALPPDRRTFVAVGERFGVSGERVGQIARRDGWAKTLEDLEVETTKVELRELRRVFETRARSRVERVARTLEVYDRATDVALAKIPIGEDGELDLDQLPELRLESVLSALPGLHRMAELAAGEATDRVAISEVQPILVAFARIAVLHAPADTRGEVYRELSEASAGLIQLPGAAG